jgi:Helicase conserved C-terminal domain
MGWSIAGQRDHSVRGTWPGREQVAQFIAKLEETQNSEQFEPAIFSWTISVTKAVMIATEAAAEGINLQFCLLVVNYDMPWSLTPAKAKAKAVDVHGLTLPLLPPALVSDFFCLVRHPRLLELPEQSEHEVVSGIE